MKQLTLVGSALLALAFCAWAFSSIQTPPSPNLPAAVGEPNMTPLPPGATTTPPLPTEPPFLFPYIEVIDSCGPYYQGECVLLRSGPGTEYPVVARLRIGVVLKVEETILVEGKKWHKIALDEEIRYPERVTSDWYVAADAVDLLYDDGDHRIKAGEVATTSKHILVDLSEQKLYAYEKDELFMEQSISTGLELTPTPLGTFTIYKMTPRRYMQGPLPGVSGDYYDLPGVPWNLYFTTDGAVIHGAYWHDHFGQRWSHGCINLPLDKAKDLYFWAELGTQVTVKN